MTILILFHVLRYRSPSLPVSAEAGEAGATGTGSYGYP
jgi:hypothetical protein